MFDELSHDTLFSNRILDLTLLPIEQCNLRCTYCYERFTDGQMAPWLVESLKALLARRAPELDFLRIGWFGGEPLLAHDLVVHLSRHAQQLMAPGAFIGGMSTNGYLLDAAMMARMTDVGVQSFQVSIDGLSEQHDLTRPRRNGAGSFDRIWRNMLELRGSDLQFNVNLRVHYAPANIDHVRTFTDLLRDQFGGDQRFQIFFKTVEHLGGENDGKFEVYGHEEAQRIKAELMQRIDGKIRDVLPSGGCYVCYAGKPNAFVIRRDGRIVKCTVGLDEARNQIGRMLPDGAMQIDDARMRPWMEGAVNLDAGFLSCPRARLLAHEIADIA